GAREALLRTPDQLDVLARAGVVDAGGQAFVLLVDVLVEVLGGPPAQPLEDVVAPLRLPGHRQAGPRIKAEYEVMYAIRDARKTSLDALRRQLSELGNSVVIVGDQTLAQVHVHLADPGPALEAGLSIGQLSQIRVTALEPDQTDAVRTVVSMVAGPGLVEAVLRLGGIPVQGGRGQLTLEELSAALDTTCGEAVILPNDMENLEMASHLASRLKAEGRRVAVIPTVAQVQGLAAIAVHEPTADFESAVVAMSAAAGHTRHGAVTIAESSAMTMAGRCQPGDVLGLVEGDFVEIGTSVTNVALRVIERLLAAGGELLTLVGGADAEPGLVEELQRLTLRLSDGVDVETVIGGQHRYLVLIGLE
ncbi:MAG: Dak phosphatase, partial [Propionibacteriaceae bacterium]|nr:Dak phosphatase [Propionibacteriaceae bacterium]